MHILPCWNSMPFSQKHSPKMKLGLFLGILPLFLGKLNLGRKSSNPCGARLPKNFRFPQKQRLHTSPCRGAKRILRFRAHFFIHHTFRRIRPLHGDMGHKVLKNAISTRFKQGFGYKKDPTPQGVRSFYHVKGAKHFCLKSQNSLRP